MDIKNATLVCCLSARKGGLLSRLFQCKDIKKMETRLTTLRKKNRALWTQDDYEFVKMLGDKHGIKFVLRAGCADCYNEYFFSVCLAEARARQIDLLKNTKRKWFLRAGLRVVWNGKKINEGNCNDKIIAKLLAKGFPRRLVFSRDELLKKYGIEDRQE